MIPTKFKLKKKKKGKLSTQNKTQIETAEMHNTKKSKSISFFSPEYNSQPWKGP